MSTFHRISQPPITAEFLGRLKAVFRAPDVSAKSDPDKMKWDAAQYQVVQWIENFVGEWAKTVPAMEEIKPVQDEVEEEIQPAPEPRVPWYKRLWKKLRGS